MALSPPRWCWRRSTRQLSTGSTARVEAAARAVSPASAPPAVSAVLGGCGDGLSGFFGNPGIGGAARARPGANGANGTFVVQAGATWLRQQSATASPGPPAAVARVDAEVSAPPTFSPSSVVARVAWVGRAGQQGSVAPEGTPAAGRSACTRSTPPSSRLHPPCEAATVGTVETAERVATVGLASPVSSELPASASPSSSRCAGAMDSRARPVERAAAAAAAAVGSGDRAPVSTRVA